MSEWTPQQVRPGDALIATDAGGQEHDCIATSSYESERGADRVRRHDFPVIWVKFSTKGDAIPWPVESLRVSR